MGKDSIALVPFANVHKTFGANGELIIKLFPEAPEEINLSEPVFITIDERPVPFFLKSFEARGNNRALVIFDDMESMALAEELVGKKVFSRQLTAGLLRPACNDELSDCFAPFVITDSRQINNYKVKDETVGDIGIVSGFMDIPGNPCLVIINGKHEIMIPYREEFILKIDRQQQIITTRLPEGLINLNRPT
jgi:16S rRNA processing protein RimM